MLVCGSLQWWEVPKPTSRRKAKVESRFVWGVDSGVDPRKCLLWASHLLHSLICLLTCLESFSRPELQLAQSGLYALSCLWRVLAAEGSLSKRSWWRQTSSLVVSGFGGRGEAICHFSVRVFRRDLFPVFFASRILSEHCDMFW